MLAPQCFAQMAPGCALPEIGRNDRRGGNISPHDCIALVPSPDGARGDQYRVQVQGPGTLRVVLRSGAFDAFLVVYDPATNNVVCADDDSAGGLDAQCIVNLMGGAVRIFHLVARPRTAEGGGAYTLTTEFRPAAAPQAPACPASPWRLTDFAIEPFAEACPSPDGSVLRRFRFEVDHAQAATIELVAPGGADTRVTLACAGGVHLQASRRIQAQLEPGSCELTIRRGPGAPVDGYLLRSHGECGAQRVAPGARLERNISPADCRIREIPGSGVEEATFAQKYEFQLKERSRCVVSCEVGVQGCYSASGRIDDAVAEGAAVLSPSEYFFYVVADASLREVRSYDLRLQCAAAPCSWQSLAVGDELNRGFEEDDCRLCDYVPGAACTDRAHAYSVSLSDLPVRVETDPPGVHLLDAAGRRLPNPFQTTTPYRFLAVHDADYRIRVQAAPPPCPDRTVHQIAGVQGQCAVQDFEPGGKAENIPLEGVCRLVDSDAFARLFRFTLVRPGRFRARLIPRGFTGPRMILLPGCGNGRDEGEASLEAELAAGVHILIVSSRNPSFGRFDLMTAFTAVNAGR